MKTITKLIAAFLVAMMTVALFVPISAEAASKKAEKSKEYGVKIFDSGSYSYVERKGKYEGEIKDGVPNGEGTFFLTNNNDISYTVSGTFKDGVPDGEIIMRFDRIEGYTLVQRNQTYKDGVIKTFVDRYENGEDNRYSYNGINTGKGYYVIYTSSDGYKETFHVNESGEMTMDAFDNLYVNDSITPGFCGADLNLSDTNVFKLEKMRVASKSAIKKKAKKVSGDEIAEDPEKYEGNLIKLENAIMEDYFIYADENDYSRVVFEAVTFLADYYRYTLFFEPGTVKYKNGKVVDLNYVSLGASNFLLSDGTYEGRVTGWIVGKTSKSSATNATYSLYKFGEKKYVEYDGVFSGPIKDGKPNGLGVFSYKISDRTVNVTGSFFGDRPLDGVYSASLVDGDESNELTYAEGKCTHGIVTIKVREEETGDIAGEWTYYFGHTSGKDRIAQLVYFNNNFFDASHIDEVTNEPGTDGIDVYFSVLNDWSTAENEVNTDLNSYFFIDRIRLLSKKKIRKQAGEMNVSRMLVDICALGEDVFKLDDVKVIEAVKSEYVEGKYYTEVRAEVDGYCFMFFVDGKKNLKAGDKVTVYFTPGGTANITNEDATEESFIFAYAYDIKKAK